jgi:hypothetical protein
MVGPGGANHPTTIRREQYAMKFKVIYNDGREVEGWAGPRAEVEIERKFDISADKVSRNEHLYYLFWAGLFYAGQETREFDDWLVDVKDWDLLEPAGKGGKGNPTRPGRRPAKSST